LKSPAREVAENFILVPRAGVTGIDKHFDHSIYGNIVQARRGSKTVTLAEAVKDLRPLIGLKLVHVFKMTYSLLQSSIIYQFAKKRKFLIAARLL